MVICFKHGYLPAQLLATQLLHRNGYDIARGYDIGTVIVLKHGYCVEHDYAVEDAVDDCHGCM